MLRLLLLATLATSAGCNALSPISPLARLEQRMVFQPAKYPDGNWQPADLNHEDAWFEAADGTRLHGWFVECPQPRAVALFCHGNAGNVTSRANELRTLRDRHGLSVLCFDYRGYGRSDGIPTEEGLIMDARAASRWLAQRAGVPESDILLMGRSLGGGVAAQLAAEDGARGLVLASTFTSLPDVGAEHLPWMSPRLVMRNRFDSLAVLPRYQGPVLISHGDADEVIPYEHGRQLYEACSGPKQFISISGGRHNDPQSEDYRAALDAFIAALP